MRTMYDSVNASAIPLDAEMVAGYVDGLYRWSAADWNRFPNAYQVTITIGPSNAHVLDIENGNAAPTDAPAWIRRQHIWIKFPTVYCNRGNLTATWAACSAAGLVQGRDYDLWLADYTQQPHCPDWAAACQYADPGPYDLSLCNDWWPRDVVNQGGDDMPLNDADKQWLIDVIQLPVRQDLVEVLDAVKAVSDAIGSNPQAAADAKAVINELVKRLTPPLSPS